MSDITPQDQPAPVPHAVPVTAETIAERHLAHEVANAEKRLRWTQTGSVLLCLFTLGYLAYLTDSIHRTLEPQAAAEIAQGLIGQQVEDRATDLSNDLKTRVPKMIASFPDYAKREIPEYRSRLEKQIDSDLNHYLNQHSAELSKMVDEALEEHKDKIAAMLKDSKDPAVVHLVGEDLQDRMVRSLNDVSLGSESLQTKLDLTLASLTELDKRMAKLAANKNLTPSEKKARRAIALLSTTINHKQQESGTTASFPPTTL